MAKYDFVGGGFVIEDVNGSFAKFVREAPKVMRQCVYEAIDKTCFSLSRRIGHSAPVGPESPHLKNASDWTRRGLIGQAGYLEGKGGEQIASADAVDWNGLPITNALVAMFNEYGVRRKGGGGKNPNPWMKREALLEAPDFVKRMKSAIGQAERSLTTNESLSSKSSVSFQGLGQKSVPRGTGAGQGIFKK